MSETQPEPARDASASATAVRAKDGSWAAGVRPPRAAARTSSWISSGTASSLEEAASEGRVGGLR